ncbi:hypothetical protein HYALB_00003972 [Hymenoscyphus albidus]|uniref:WSC domain-containing protein n=1 Tax=Hymenoscyphus albidus TaxID=595503 RepID=A0A9N9LXQ7_9HELO|nr:hypothetical protein HYALB_00003972 [Hymenoscyphus albidus]
MLQLKLIAVASTFLAFFSGVNATQGPAKPSCVDFTPYVYGGCYQNPSNGPHTLLFNSDLDSQNMTVEKCVAFCKGNSYRYAGLEYYGQCTCGASVNGMKVEESLCSYPCTANKNETCGGSNVVSVYGDPTFPTVNITDTSDYKAIGCYTEGTSGRSLVWRQDQVPSGSMTVKKCLSACKVGGYDFAGVEYAQECYCGVVLGNGTVPAPASECSMNCTGDSTESCGGPSRLNLFVASDLESSEPCKDGSGPTTSSKSSTGTSSTVPPTSSKTSLSTSTSSSYSTSSSDPTTTSTASPTSSSYSTSSSDPTTSSSSTSISSSYSSSSTSSCTTTSSSSASSSVYTPPYTPPTPPTTSSTSTSLSSTAPTTTSRPTTPPSPLTTTKTTPSLCTSTTTIAPAPTCEYQCGNWCSTPLPDWNDQASCFKAQANCIVQVTSCLLHAGFPASLDCLKFSGWCLSVQSYCFDFCPGKNCQKSDCKSKYPPNHPNQPNPPGSVSTSVYTCQATSASPTPTKPSPTTSTAVPLPTNSNICCQPDNPPKGYGSLSPVGGIALPCLTCNNLMSDYNAGNPFKLYLSSQSSDCPSYPRGGPSGLNQACKDACDAQYQSCQNTYAKGCQNNAGPQYSDSYPVATNKCYNQWKDCYAANSNVNPSPSRCGSWNSGWY